MAGGEEVLLPGRLKGAEEVPVPAVVFCKLWGKVLLGGEQEEALGLQHGMHLLSFDLRG